MQLIRTTLLFLVTLPSICLAQQPPSKAGKPLAQLQQEFIDLRFGMFIHYNIPTYIDQDWADPQASPAIFNPRSLNCDQWAKAAKSANMSYGCLTTKHHSGFALWDTKTTDYNVMNSPLKKDVVKEYVNAFRANHLKVMLYYSILDTHHELRKGLVSAKHIDMVKAQLMELLTNYGEITALIIDGWDAPWSRISYDDIPFQEIYALVKSIQPNCLLMDLNSAKYPGELLYYTDIKSYEQNAGEHISKETNRLPALSCYPINKNWFWKKTFPTDPVKDPVKLVKENLEPLNNAFCNFILNVSPNPSGLLDDNTITALKKIGDSWKNSGPLPTLPAYDAPVIASNLAKKRVCYSSWSDDMWIMDFANDDDFTTAWQSNPTVKNPWYEVVLDKYQPFNAIVLAQENTGITSYHLEYNELGVWKTLFTGENNKKIRIHRFAPVWGSRVRIVIDRFTSPPHISEFGVFNEKRDQ